MIKKLEGQIKKPKDFKIKIVYTPTIPTYKDIDQFEFTDDENSIVKIIVKGESVGN